MHPALHHFAAEEAQRAAQQRDAPQPHQGAAPQVAEEKGKGPLFLRGGGAPRSPTPIGGTDTPVPATPPATSPQAAQ
eukprot:2765438-Pyramimonas_sp.AAC.1